MFAVGKQPQSDVPPMPLQPSTAHTRSGHARTDSSRAREPARSVSKRPC